MVIKMRKYIILFVFIISVLSGCADFNTDINSSQNDVSVILPDSETAATVNGYYITPIEDEIRYYGNTKSLKFHTKDCVWISKTDGENLKGYKDRKQLIDEGYTPCKTCKP